MSDGVIVLAGTTKGAFVLRADAERAEVTIDGPHFPGHEVYAMALDQRDGQRLLVSRTSPHFGPGIAWSDDLGTTWTDPNEANVAFPDDTGASLARVWQLEPAGPGEPGLVYAGVEPAALFRSEDRGETYSLVRGLWDHPHRPEWEPGGGGLCLHTIVCDDGDPATMWIGVSAAGVYRTTDGGQTWEPRNRGIRTPFNPEPEPPEFGQCVHKFARHPDRPDRLFLQHHWGVYRSDDRGDTWVSIGESMPADAPPIGSEPRPFGFPIVIHPRDPDTVYVIPLASDFNRWTVDGRCRVFRSQDAGDSWHPLAAGLPQEHAYLTVLRDAFTADPLDPVGLWFGTRTGEIYASADEGERWRVVAEHLPPVTCVKAYAA